MTTPTQSAFPSQTNIENIDFCLLSLLRKDKYLYSTVLTDVVLWGPNLIQVILEMNASHGPPY